MSESACRDPFGCFLAAYEEYFDGRRRYEDLPPKFATCAYDHGGQAAVAGEASGATMSEIPLGYSEEYDLLPAEGEEMRLPCQGCDRTFADRMRRLGSGCQVLAVLCPDCRSTQRMRFAAPLPVARTVRR